MYPFAVWPALVGGAAAAASAASAPRESPVVTAFFPQLLGGIELAASVVAVKDSVTTLFMCGDGSKDSLLCSDMQWTFIYGESTASIDMTASATGMYLGKIACAVTSSLHSASCTATGAVDGTTTSDSIVLSQLTDFITTFTITAGADKLTDSPPSATAPAGFGSAAFGVSSSSSTVVPAGSGMPSSPGATAVPQPASTSKPGDDKTGAGSGRGPASAGAVSGVAMAAAGLAGFLVMLS